MSFDNFILYAITAFLAAISPDPSVIFTINTAAYHGMRLALISALGNTIAIFILSVISAIGLGATIVASGILYNTIKLLGACPRIDYPTAVAINWSKNSCFFVK
ncbi:LysE family translocator [Candidatus Sororendozoicomonas aggregata]|uniref:LysE family translocator n=1 Tax=Candidatus Sororendozoicomonas aggregata TaxID=3073239 RepID=UPI002ED5FE3F